MECNGFHQHCEETRYDTLGDCDGREALYVTTEPGAIGLPINHSVILCASHAMQAGGRHQIRKPTPAEASQAGVSWT